MAAIKSYSDLEQSKKLAKFLPLESADMYWMHGKLDNVKQHPTPNIIGNDHDEPLWNDYDIPCWSFAALLGVLPNYTMQTDIDGTVFVVCESKKPMISDAYDNPVDACVEMIEYLHELKML